MNDEEDFLDKYRAYEEDEILRKYVGEDIWKYGYKED